MSGVEVKTQADSDDVDITECLHDDKPIIGTLYFSLFWCVTLYRFLAVILTIELQYQTQWIYVLLSNMPPCLAHTYLLLREMYVFGE